jgi:hypothetical protein
MDKKALQPVLGDDAGNLVKAGYEPTQIKVAQKHYDEMLKEHPEDMANVTFSEYLFNNAVLAYYVKFGMKKK